MKTILITGSSGGIGKELVKVFSSSGYRVIGIDKRKINYKNYTHINLELEKFTELSKSEQKKLVRKINMITNSDGINILINNAAMQIKKDIMSLTNKDFLQSFKINALAPFNLTKLFYDDLVKNNGKIINIGSVHSKLTKPEFAAYSTSKSALDAITTALSLELGDKVVVNSIDPAAVNTDMLSSGLSKKDYSKLASYSPTKQIGQPSEIAELALFLAETKSKFLNGSKIKITGGIHNRLHDPS